MSPFQMAKQIRSLLRAAVWDVSPYGAVVGDQVYITAGIRDEDDLPATLPFALLNPGTQSADKDDPNLVTQEFVLVIATQVWGDPMGEHSLVGGPGADSDRFSVSDGRGLLDLERALLASVGRLTGADGTPIIVSHGSAPAPERFGEDTHLVHRQYVLSAVCSRADEYPAPSGLVVSVATPGQAALSWFLAPPHYGRRRTIVRYAAGSTAPATATSGTGVTLASDTSTSVTVTLAAGTYSFAIFTPYTESGAASDEKYSSQVTGTTRTAVVA